MMDIFEWIERELGPRTCDSVAFFYDEMDSQSGYSLPIVYRPFDAGDRSHWQDRGALFDFLYSTQGEGKRLLDFGPGDGWPSLIVAPFAGEVVGVDGSRRRVDVCSANARRLGMGNARFVHVAPGTPLPFDAGAFDGAMAASSVEQTPDPRAALRELFRVLRPGGRLRISYEGLGRYRGDGEREAKLHENGDGACWLTLWDRRIEKERARMIRLSLAMGRGEVRELCDGDDGYHPPYASITIPLLERLCPSVTDARLCLLTHPSGETLVSWLEEIGFGEVFFSHAGAWLAGQLFDQLAEQGRPQDVDGVDRMLRPLVRAGVRVPLPPDAAGGLDPMITAVK